MGLLLGSLAWFNMLLLFPEFIKFIPITMEIHSFFNNGGSGGAAAAAAPAFEYLHK